MLNTTEKITYTGTSEIDGKVCERFTASIDPANPENLTLSFVITDRDGYRDNREQCHKDQAEFEDEVYAAQAQLNSKTEDNE